MAFSVLFTVKPGEISLALFLPPLQAQHLSRRYRSTREVTCQCDSPVLALTKVLWVMASVRNRHQGEIICFLASESLHTYHTSAPGHRAWEDGGNCCSLPPKERLRDVMYGSLHCNSGAGNSGGFSLKRHQHIRQVERSDLYVGCNARMTRPRLLPISRQFFPCDMPTACPPSSFFPFIAQIFYFF